MHQQVVITMPDDPPSEPPKPHNHDQPPELTNNPESVKFILQLQDRDAQTGEPLNVEVVVEFVIYWDTLEDLLIAAGHDPVDLGYELTRQERERLADLAVMYQVNPNQYIRVRRSKPRRS